MMNPSEQQVLRSSRQQRRRQLQHSKESGEFDAVNVGQAPVVAVEETTTTTSTITTTTLTTTAAVHEEAELSHNKGQSEDTNTDEQPQKTLAQIQEEYEAQFPSEPETSHAATTFTLFSDPNRFSSESIASSTHYLTDSLYGTLWLDADGDGKRGSESDSTLNALEYDTGIGGVTVSLVECESNELVSQGTSLPNDERGIELKKISGYAESGQYSFPLDTIESGRYYIMYRSPENFRISGNVLPLKQKITEDGANFECIPRGGEGIDYLEQVRESGDLNIGGYCARSIGCLEVDQISNLEGEFEDLKYLPVRSEEDYVGATKTLVALPFTSMLNVGLAEEDWPLSTYQFADAQITLSFPSSVSESDLSSAVPEAFGKSEVKQNLETTLLEWLVAMKGESPFDVQGVDISSGDISVPRDAASDGAEDTGALRGLRGLQTSLSQYSSVTYTLTARGSYRPPPFKQLGTILQESINDDSKGLVKSLKDKEGGLPPLFNNVEGVSARHLTLKTLQGPGSLVWMIEAPSPRMASWAISPVIIISILIISLTGIFIFRRVYIFTRLTKVEDEEKQRPVDPPGVEPTGYLDDGIRVTVVSNESSNEDSEERRRRERRERRHERYANQCGIQSTSHTSSDMTRSGNSQPASTNGSRSNHGSGSHGNGGNLLVTSLQSSGQSSTCAASMALSTYNAQTSEQGGRRRRNRKKKKRKPREGGQQVAHSIVERPPRRTTRANVVSTR